MSTLNLNEFKRTTIGHYIDHCNQSIDAMTREVFSQSETPAKEKLVKIFQECMKQLGDFLSLSPDKRTKDAPFPKFAVRICLRNNPSILKQLEELKLTLAGETDCDFPLPPIRIDENGLPQPLSIQDQQEIQNAICLGVAKKVSSLKKELCETRKSVEEDAKAAALAKAEILKSENKRKADEMHAILIKASTREGALELVQENSMHLKYLKALRDDFEIVELAIRKEPKSFQFASPRLKNHPALIKLMLQQENSDHILEFLSQETMKDKERLLDMVRYNELTLAHAVDDGYDLEFLLEALLENPMCYQLLNESLRKNKEIFDLFMMLILENEDFQLQSILFVLPEEFHPLARAYFAIEQDYGQYLSFSEDIQKDNALIAYYFIQSIDEDYIDGIMGFDSLEPNDENFPEQENLEDVFEFINEVPSERRAFARCLCEARLLNVFDISQLSEELKTNIHVILSAVKSNNIRFESLPETFKSSSFYLKLLVKTDVDFYQQLPEEQRKTPSLAKIALSKDLSLFQYLPSPLNENEEFIIEILQAETFNDDDDMPYTFLTSLPASLRENERVILAAIEHIPHFYMCLDDAEKENPIYALKAADSGCFTFFHAIPAPLRAHQTLLLKVLSKSPELITHYSDDFKRDEDFLYAALEENPKIFRYINFDNFKDLNRLYVYLARKIHDQLTAYLDHYISGLMRYRLKNQKAVHEELLIKILNEHLTLTKSLLGSYEITKDFSQEYTMFLRTFRRFFLNNPEKFKVLASLPKSELNLPEELLIDLIGHDSSFFSILHESYLKSPFIEKAIKANSDVYDRLIPAVAKALPPFKLARAQSVPYYRPLNEES